jgi:glycosyltransferase involved in cell wall biosynthesis
MSFDSAPFKTLQLGMHWFPERPGGLDRVYYELSRALPGAGMGFRGLVAGSSLCDMETNGAVRAFAPADGSLPRRWLGMRRAFRRALMQQNPEIIVSHFALYTLPVLDLIKERPFVIHFQGPWADEGEVEGHSAPRHAAKRAVESLVYRRAGRAIVLSNAFAEILLRRYDFPAERIAVIPGGIDVARFAVDATRAQARERLGWPADRPIVVAVRRLVPRMGLENLVAACAVLRRAVPDILLMIAGRGVLQAQLAAQIEAAGLGSYVKLLGFVSDDDLPLLYRGANLSVVSTVALEGFGLIVAESLAAGTPCLVTPVGGLPEIVTALCPNMVLPGVDAGALAEGIQAALLGQMKLPDDATCRAYAVENFAWGLIASRVAEVYRDPR